MRKNSFKIIQHNFENNYSLENHFYIAMLTYYQMHPQEQLSMKFQSKNKNFIQENVFETNAVC